MPSSTANLSRSPSPHDDSIHGDNVSGSSYRAPKDKECPFCHQSFTSSSLGRHLDLYIKPKNPKPPDGVHDVHKIRDIRGKITRRQPRGNTKRQDHQSDASEAGGDSPPLSHSAASFTAHTPSAPAATMLPTPPAPSVPPEHPAPTATPAAPPAPAAPIEPRPMQATSAPSMVGKRMLSGEREGDPLSPSTWGSPSGALRLPPDPTKLVFGTNWQSTGVITGLPTHSADMERFARPSWCIHETKLAPIRGKSDDRAHLEGDETGQAAQLALREVLDSIEAARHRESRPSMWDFDFYGSSFPGLCLKLLPAPRLLFSLHPSSSDDSWPLEPPGPAHLSALHDIITTRGAKIGFAPQSVEVQRAMAHADSVFNLFANQSATEKHETWHLETLRALAKSQKLLAERNAELKLARQQAEFFRQQFERTVASTRRSAATSPTSASLPPDSRPDMVYAQGLSGGPGPLALAPETSETFDHDPDARAWSYDRLIAKWRGKLRDSASGPPPPPPSQLPPQQQQQNGHMPSRASSAASPPATLQGGSPTASALSRGGGGGAEREVRFLWDDGRPRAGTGGSSSAPPGEGPRRERGSGGGAADWVDAAAGAVERVWTLGALERGKALPPPPHSASYSVQYGEEGAGFNANGKRARPPSWPDVERGNA